MTEALVRVANRTDPLVIRINGQAPTFRLSSDRIEASLLAPLPPVLLDLLDVAATVFAADSSVPRGTSIRGKMGAAWRREFDFMIPVRCPDVWDRVDVKAHLSELVEVLSEDRATFAFKRRASEDHQEFLNLDPDGAVFHAEEVVLFSGGLDSFAGALEALSTRSGNLLLVSHASAQKVIARQKRLAAFLESRFPGRLRHLSVRARRVGQAAREPTQRTRSLLFAALAQVVAQGFGAERISFYENGIVSHNLPISSQVVGTMATRTTHPLSLLRLNELMQAIVEQPAAISNGYEWLTKTEVVERIARHEGEEMIGAAVSCTSVRDQTNLHTHCGACSQCLDRRFATLAAGLEGHDPAESYGTDVLAGARPEERSRVLAVDWTRNALGYVEKDEVAFAGTFALEVSRIAKGYPQLGTGDVWKRVHALHRRQGRHVHSVLTGCIATMASDLAQQRLPETALLRMLVGSGAPGDTLSTVARPESGFATPHDAISEAADHWSDVGFDTEAPLRCAFFKEEKRAVVAVQGIGRIRPGAAEVAHCLKPQFDEDRSDGVAHANYFYVQRTHIERSLGISDTTVRQHIRRCRADLKKQFRDLYGLEMPDQVLIQSGKWQGYRLDPTIEIISEERLEEGASHSN